MKSLAKPRIRKSRAKVKELAWDVSEETDVSRACSEVYTGEDISHTVPTTEDTIYKFEDIEKLYKEQKEKSSISGIECCILPAGQYEENSNPLFLAKGLSPSERIFRYANDPKISFKYICAKYDYLNFESDSVQVTLLPGERKEIVTVAKEMYDHGARTGRFRSDNDQTRTLADMVKGNTGELAGLKLLNAVFGEFGLDTHLNMNTLKYDCRGDGGRDSVVGLYDLDFKYRNDINFHTDLVVSSYKTSIYNLLVHTHSIRRSDDQNYSDEYYLRPEDSSHIVVIRGGTTGAYFSQHCATFKNGRNVLEDSKRNLIPIWDLCLFLAIQAAKQEGFIK